jgi:hypothetical protein
MKVPWLVAPVVLAVACSTAHTGTQVRSAPPASSTSTTGWTVTSSSSLPGSPTCQEPGVMPAVMKIVGELKTNPTQAKTDFTNAPKNVQTCLTTPNEESSTAGVQQVSP